MVFYILFPIVYEWKAMSLEVFQAYTADVFNNEIDCYWIYVCIESIPRYSYKLSGYNHVYTECFETSRF